MKFTLIPLNLPSIADEATSGREPGLHVSSIIKRLLLQLDANKYGSEITDDTRTLWEMGLAWEDIALGRAFWKRILRRTFPKRAIRQVQAELDLIWGTCDMLGLGPRRLIVESKLTRISMVNEIESQKFWSWRVQMMAYCKMWDTTHALIPVCFLNGDYRPPRIIPRAWDVEFTQAEVDENWAMMLQGRDEIISEQKKKKRKKSRG